MILRSLCVVLLAVAGHAAIGQQTPPQTTPAPVERRDPVLDAASNRIGRALYLRCFCKENDIAFDAAGHPPQGAKETDWTLAGMSLQKVERKGPKEIELDGVRVAIRYAPDRHEFDRHVLNDEKMRLVLPDTGDAAAFVRTLDAVFSTGIDVRLQHAMPDYWQHYFNPSAPWPADALTGTQMLTPGAPGAPAGLTEPQVAHKSNASYTDAASHDKVEGFVLLRFVVDAEGTPQRIAILQPLGYGLDERGVEAVSKYRFAPGMLDGKAAATNVQVKQTFEVVARQ